MLVSSCDVAFPFGAAKTGKPLSAARVESAVTCLRTQVASVHTGVRVVAVSVLQLLLATAPAAGEWLSGSLCARLCTSYLLPPCFVYFRHFACLQLKGFLRREVCCCIQCLFCVSHSVLSFDPPPPSRPRTLSMVLTTSGAVLALVCPWCKPLPRVYGVSALPLCLCA